MTTFFFGVKWDTKKESITSTVNISLLRIYQNQGRCIPSLSGFPLRTVSINVSDVKRLSIHADASSSLDFGSSKIDKCVPVIKLLRVAVIASKSKFFFLEYPCIKLTNVFLLNLLHLLSWLPSFSRTGTMVGTLFFLPQFVSSYCSISVR